MSKFKVGDVVTVIDAVGTMLSVADDEYFIVQSLEYDETYHDPTDYYVDKANCVYGTSTRNQGQVFLKKCCIRKLTKLELALK